MAAASVAYVLKRFYKKNNQGVIEASYVTETHTFPSRIYSLGANSIYIITRKGDSVTADHYANGLLLNYGTNTMFVNENPGCVIVNDIDLIEKIL